MKKLFCMLLALVMLAGLSACGIETSKPTNEPANESGAAPNSSSTGTGSTKAEPTTEELEQIEKYANAVSALNEFAKEGYVPSYKDGESYVSGNEALGRWYQDIVDAASIEKWIDTQYTADDAINWNRQEILDSFVIIEDVLLVQHRRREDAVGNLDGEGTTYYAYNADGNLISTDSGGPSPMWFSFGWSIECEVTGAYDVNYIYDNEGILTQIKCLSYGKKDIKFLITPTYNEKGLKISDSILEADGDTWEFIYVYDSNDQLISISDSRDKSFSATCSYDSLGNISRYSDSYGYNREYTYSDDYTVCTLEEYCLESGTIIAADTYVFTFDELGRIVTCTITDQFAQSKASVEQIYGNYYVYLPAEKN